MTVAMFQNIQDAVQEQKQEFHAFDDVTVLVTEQIGKVMPLVKKTSQQF